MPILSESDLAKLRARPPTICLLCEQVVRENYCTDCDLFFGDGHLPSCKLMAPDRLSENHRHHSAYNLSTGERRSPLPVLKRARIIFYRNLLQPPLLVTLAIKEDGGSLEELCCQFVEAGAERETDMAVFQGIMADEFLLEGLERTLGEGQGQPLLGVVKGIAQSFGVKFR